MRVSYGCSSLLEGAAGEGNRRGGGVGRHLAECGRNRLCASKWGREREKFEQGPWKCSAGGNIPAVLRTGENELQIWTSPGREGCSGMDQGQS